MFALSPLAIALQGLGFGPLLTALHGLIPIDEPPVVVAPSRADAGGGPPVTQTRRRRLGKGRDARVISPAKKTAIRKLLDEEAVASVANRVIALHEALRSRVTREREFFAML